MRVALFSEHDPAIPCGTAPTIAALIGHSPDDIQIVSYHLHAIGSGDFAPDRSYNAPNRSALT
jgi:hypothetical protein